jgi:hypothetical protein
VDTVAPEAPEPPATAEATAERAAPRRRWKVPTSIVVTFLGIALTAWLLPAFTHQWDDRQKVRELQAQFADAIAVGTATALSKGALAASQTSTVEARRIALDPIESDWEIARTRIQLKLSAYFPRAVVTAWQDFGLEVVRFLRVCRYVGFPTKGYEFVTGFWLGLLNLTKEQLERPSVEGPLEFMLQNPNYRRKGLELTRAFMLAHATEVTETMLRAHAAGYSTTKRDLINDLLPF